MDLVVHWPGTVHLTHLDVTVRCPHATRYAGSESEIGVAARGGERDKRDRYGERVHAISLETYGRFGEAARATLAKLAHEARVHGYGWRLSPTLAEQWQNRAERAVLYAGAEVLLQSLGHLFTERPHRIVRGMRCKQQSAEPSTVRGDTPCREGPRRGCAAPGVR